MSVRRNPFGKDGDVIPGTQRKDHKKLITPVFMTSRPTIFMRRFRLRTTPESSRRAMKTHPISGVVIVFLPGCFRGFGGIIPFSARFPGPVALPVVSPFWNSRWIWFLAVFITWERPPSFLEMRMRRKHCSERLGMAPLSGYRRWRGSAKLLPGNGPVRLVKRSSTRILEVQVAEEIQTTPYERTEGNYSESWPEGARWQQYRARLPLWCRR